MHCAATMKGTTAMMSKVSCAVALALAVCVAGASLAADAPRMKGIGWLVIRSHDRNALAEFYLALGFQEWASSERIVGLRAGGGAALEIGHLDPGTPPNPPRESRTQARAMAIFGVSDVEEVVKRARANGATNVLLTTPISKLFL